MIAELEPIFKKYEALVKQVDEAFEKVRSDYPDCVKCKQACADCCHALFDLSLVEALYINHKFHKNIGDKKGEIFEAANRTDRKLHQLKRKMFKAVENGQKTEELILLEMAAERSRCPLLNEENRCDLYDFRPVTCRLYGIPTSINGRGHTCGLSGFKEGVSYPTVNLDAVIAKMSALSQEIVTALRSTQVKMGDVLMPLSMALLTVFDEEFLGVPSERRERDEGQE
jgi:Fe-S-cluster containining protein